MQNESKTDILTETDIHQLVDCFYDKVRNDVLLAPIFNQVIKADEWETHLIVMRNFWSSILLYTRKYLQDPMSKHFPLAINASHFERWLALFFETIDELFIGETANEAKRRAKAIADLIQAVKP